MRIDELDEWQGLTPDMVREWLRNRGWSLHGEMPRYWEKGSRNFADSLIDGNSDDVAFVIHCEEIAAGLTRQESLRQINPRMRKGMPSEAARKAHPLGLWLAMPDFDSIGAKVSIVVSLPPDDEGFSVWHPEGFSFPDSKPHRPELWLFWPCDESGNKARWPTDANGAML